MPRPIVIVGSINMDLVCRTQRIPRAGETILGDSFVTIPGGKGANQAVAAAKLAPAGTPVHMIGRVGEDDFGERLLNGLSRHKVNTKFVTVTEGVASGVGIVLVDQEGENSIVVAPGANARLSPADVDKAEALIRSASVVVMQLEVPYATIRRTIAICRDAHVFTILDPAPAPRKPLARAMHHVDIFTPNQSEAELLLGLEQSHRVKRKRIADPKQTSVDLLSRGPRAVVLKLGPKGCLYASRDAVEAAGAFRVKVRDTTAAGDAFTAALAVAHAERMPRSDMLTFANAAGALCCTEFGAQPALPARADVKELMNRPAGGSGIRW
ncbi:MAG: ribokinase [Tepidisphaeraceae bacterium]